MLKYLKENKWSAYRVGFFIALLALGSLLVFHKTIGTSTTFVKLAAMVWSAIDSNHVQSSSYYQEYLNNKTWVDWQFALVVGIFIGALFSRSLTSKQKKEKKPTTKITFRRCLAAFLGGIIVMVAARFAGGCTSGHAISGGFQLALSGWLFMIGLFSLGIPTAFLLYRKKETL